MELTPRELPDKGQRKKRPVITILILVAVVIVGFFVVRQLGQATTYFYNADEAVAQREALGTRRFRLQGTVRPDSVTQESEGISFDVVYRGVTVTVLHQGDPPELFQPNIPVVLEGSWGVDEIFLSDRMLIKHNNEYVEKNKQRIADAQNNAGTSLP